MDLIKIFLALLVLFGVSLIILQGRIRILFWMGVFLMFSRRINFPYLGDLEPSTVILYGTALLLIPKLISYIVRNYIFQVIVLALGLVVGTLFHQPSEDYYTWTIAIFSVYMLSALSYLFIQNEKGMERLSSYFIFISLIIAGTAVMAYAGFADNVIILSDNSPINMDDGLVLYSKTYGIAYSNSVNGFTPIALIFLYSKKWNNILRFIIFLLITASVFISLKRVAYISLLFSVVYIIFREGRPRIKPIIFSLVIVAAGFYFYGNDIAERFHNTGNALAGEDSPDANRTARIEYAWKHFKQFPVLGNGSGGVTFVHNGFLEILVNLGLPGLVILIPWVFKPFRILLQNRDNRQKDWAVACLIYLSTLFLFEAVLNHLDLFWIFALFYAGLESAERIYQSESDLNNKKLWEQDMLVSQ